MNWVAENFTYKGSFFTKHSFCGKAGMTELFTGYKFREKLFLVLSQFTCLTDGQTDGRRDEQTAFRSPRLALHSMHRGKNYTFQDF